MRLWSSGYYILRFMPALSLPKGVFLRQPYKPFAPWRPADGG
jgi:hypothetical protein